MFSARCPFGKMSFGKISFRQVVFGKMSIRQDVFRQDILSASCLRQDVFPQGVRTRPTHCIEMFALNEPGFGFIKYFYYHTNHHFILMNVGTSTLRGCEQFVFHSSPQPSGRDTSTICVEYYLPQIANTILKLFTF